MSARRVREECGRTRIPTSQQAIFRDHHLPQPGKPAELLLETLKPWFTETTHRVSEFSAERRLSHFIKPGGVPLFKLCP